MEEMHQSMLTPEFIICVLACVLVLGIIFAVAIMFARKKVSYSLILSAVAVVLDIVFITTQKDRLSMIFQEDPTKMKPFSLLVFIIIVCTVAGIGIVLLEWHNEKYEKTEEEKYQDSFKKPNLIDKIIEKTSKKKDVSENDTDSDTEDLSEEENETVEITEEIIVDNDKITEVTEVIDTVEITDNKTEEEVVEEVVKESVIEEKNDDLSDTEEK